MASILNIMEDAQSCLPISRQYVCCLILGNSSIEFIFNNFIRIINTDTKECASIILLENFIVMGTKRHEKVCASISVKGATLNDRFHVELNNIDYNVSMHLMLVE